MGSLGKVIQISVDFERTGRDWVRVVLLER